MPAGSVVAGGQGPTRRPQRPAAGQAQSAGRHRHSWLRHVPSRLHWRLRAPARLMQRQRADVTVPRPARPWRITALPHARAQPLCAVTAQPASGTGRTGSWMNVDVATESLAPVRTGAQPAARKPSLEPAACLEERWCRQRQAHGSQDLSALPAGNTHYAVPEENLRRQRHLKFLCLWAALLNWLSRTGRVSCLQLTHFCCASAPNKLGFAKERSLCSHCSGLDCHSVPFFPRAGTCWLCTGTLCTKQGCSGFC